MIRVFLASAYYGYKGLFFWGGPLVYFVQCIFLPLAQISFFSLIGAFGRSQPLEFYLIGNAMVVASLGGFTIGVAIGMEREIGTLSYLLASPANRVALFFGRAAIHVLEGALYVLVAFAWVLLAFGLDIPVRSWAGILLTVATGTLAVSGLGLLLGALGYLVLDAWVSGNLMIFALLLLSGANVPLSEFPPVVALIGKVLPLTRSIEAARALAAGGELATSLPLLLGDLGVGLGYGLVGFALFNWIEAQARRRGTLENV